MAELSLKADIDLLPTERGGRRRSVRDGYRPALWFGETAPSGEPELHSALVRLQGGRELLPGQRGRVTIHPLAYETWPQVKPGLRFDLFDSGRAIGRGAIRSSLKQSAAEPELRRALSNALEEWVRERFGERVARRPRLGEPLEPDLIARFDDDEGRSHALIAEVIARRPGKRDIDRLARMMERHSASLGLIVTLEEPTAASLDAIYQHGTIALSGDLWVPRIRIVTTHDIVRENIELLPTKRQPQELELRAA